MAPRRAGLFPTSPSSRRVRRVLVPAAVVVALAVPTLVPSGVTAQTDPTTTIEQVTTPPVTLPPVTLPPVTVALPTLPPETIAPITIAPPPPSTAVAETTPASVAPVIVPPPLSIDPGAILPGGGEPVTTTIDPTASTTTTIDPNATTTTSTTIDPATLVGDGSEEISPDDQPPAFIPILPPSALVPPRNISLEKALAKLSAQQKRIVDEAQRQSDAATARIAKAEEELHVLQDREVALKLEGQRLAQTREATAFKVRNRALHVYAGEAISELGSLLQSDDATAFARGLDVIGTANERDVKLLAGFREDQRLVEENLKALDDVAAAKKDELESLIVEEEILNESLATLQEQLSFVLDGQAIALNGFVFPVSAPFNFSDTFGAPRMFGTKYAHTHQGVDIFGTYGSPLYATSRGVIARKAVAVLGGNKLWLVGADGTQYYYAHLSAYAPGIEDNVVVEAGQVIGFLGDSGNAKGTPPHLHFEIHPGGGPAINPQAILDAVRKSDAGRLLDATRALNVGVSTTTTTLPPGSGNAGIGVAVEVAVDTIDASAAGPRSTSSVTPRSTTTAAQ
jgi:murein DD-endopeptidase MepM/ murein hydrolase activator NlpD